MISHATVLSLQAHAWGLHQRLYDSVSREDDTTTYLCMAVSTGARPFGRYPGWDLGSYQQGENVSGQEEGPYRSQRLQRRSSMKYSGVFGAIKMMACSGDCEVRG